MTRAGYVRGGAAPHSARSRAPAFAAFIYALLALPAAYAQSSEWPSSTNGDLPMAGIFYGNPLAGETTGNARLSFGDSSRRFRAERTGMVDAVRYNNRTLLTRNMSMAVLRGDGAPHRRAAGADGSPATTNAPSGSGSKVVRTAKRAL